MTVMQTVIDWIGTPNNIIGDAIVITCAMITFFMILEAFVYFMWKMATSRIY